MLLDLGLVKVKSTLTSAEMTTCAKAAKSISAFVPTEKSLVIGFST
jgi:hypothetical protein